jgi:hypothetical protein
MIWLDIDPNVVKPGWTPLMITVGLAVAVVLLFFSMRRQFRRINVPDDSVEPEAAAAPEPSIDPPPSAPATPPEKG